MKKKTKKQNNMNWLQKYSMTYLDIGHPGEGKYHNNENSKIILWYHDCYKLFCFQRQKEIHDHADIGNYDNYAAQGRVDLTNKVGSCSFYPIAETECRIKVIDDIVNKFSGIKFHIFKSSTDSDAYPNPESLQSYYSKLEQQSVY